MKRLIQKMATSLALIVIVALGARIAFAWDQARKVPEGVLGIVPFQNEVGNIAYALAQGKGFSNVFRMETGPTAWLTPVYPLLVAGTFKAFGAFTERAFYACVALNVLFSAVACVPIFYAGRRIAGLGVASGAAWLWALFPSAIMMPFEWIWDTSLSALLAAALLWATLAVAESERVRDWCGYGLLWGLSLLTNPALGALLPFLLGWAAFRGRGESGARWKRAAMAVGVTILCCLPWTIRNYAAFHRLIPLRSNFPLELWLGNNDIFNPHARNGLRSITRMEEARTYAQLGETEFMHEKWKVATTFMRENPGLEMQLAWNKFVAFWIGTDSPVRDFQASHSLLIQGILIWNFVTAMGALIGLIVLWKEGSSAEQTSDRPAGRRAVRKERAEKNEAENKISYAIPLGAFPIVSPCLYYVTHAYLRFREPIDPVVLLLAAVAVWRVARRAK
ncbi:MAG: glycosyltransferase family 39 protein [Candidatus Acidiferrum sp.]